MPGTIRATYRALQILVPESLDLVRRTYLQTQLPIRQSHPSPLLADLRGTYLCSDSAQGSASSSMSLTR